MNYGNLTKPSLALSVGIIWLIYLAVLAFYRLYLSPIAKFPGPKLAALSRWYEFYYDVTLRGKFTFHIQELHKKYGPIIRINPFELHIQDSEFYDELFSRTLRLDKWEANAARFGNSNSVFTTSNARLHALRRAPLSPMFSKRAIVKFQPMIRQKLEILCTHLIKYRDSGAVFNVLDAWGAFAGDVITEYAFGVTYDHLNLPDFHGSFHDCFIAIAEMGHVAVMFPWLHPLANSLPESWVAKMKPHLRLFQQIRLDLKTKIQKIKTRMADEEVGSWKEGAYPTIFEELLNSDLSPEEKSVKRLSEQAQTILGAGLETTAWALTVSTFHILNDPNISKKLNAELRDAIPDPTAELDIQQLEKLPYLTACIQESLRLSYGISTRNPRVSRTAPIKYKDWSIPPGTPVSMTTVDVHHDENVYAQSWKYIPERWLGNPQTKDGSNLNRFFVTFGKDARSCLGINLAYAEMYLALATVFRRFRLELYETDESDVRLAHDLFLPSPRLDSKGVRVKIVAVEQ